MRLIFVFLLSLLVFESLHAQRKGSKPGVIGFYTAKEDPAHISFVHEANTWFAAMGKKHGFRYDSTCDWSRLNTDTLKKYSLVIFLDARPDTPKQRRAFQQFMEAGGAWLGFHFSAFALTLSAFPQDWDWYHNVFLGSGQYVSNTWRPTTAILKMEHREQEALKGAPLRITSAPNEWYRWERDLRESPDIRILASIDNSSFPLGTGPKQHEIWHSGYYPVVWTNKKFRMVYMNMGHNDMDYEHGSNKQLSSTFSSPEQDKFILRCVRWLLQKG